MDAYTDAANMVAVEYVPSAFKRWDDFTVTVVRNSILDCLFSSREPDFIARICAHPLHRRSAQPVVRRIRSDLLDLCGATIERLRSA